MKNLIAAVIAFATLAACASTQPRHLRDLRPSANPSAVLATEIAFARAAQERGQWTAFRQFAARDAVMFVPEPVNAQDWLRRQADPPEAVRWQPHQVWSSCDGSIAVTRGAWQRPDGTHGQFTTVWQRQRNGDYRWVLDQGGDLSQPLSAPEMVEATVGDCNGQPPIHVRADGDRSWGKSDDSTLSWTTTVNGDGSRRFEVRLWRDGKWQLVLDIEFPAPAE